MKIVFIGPFGLQPKGTMSVRALPLAKALVKQGHSVTVVIPPWDDRQRSGQSWEEEGVQVINITLPPRLPVLFDIMLTRSLAAQAIALKPQVVHFFKPKGYAGLAHLLLWWLRRLGAFKARLVVDADDWEQAWNERLPYSGLQKRLFAWQENWGLRHADAVTVASRALQRLTMAHRRHDSAKIYYVPNGYPSGSRARAGGLTAQAVREKWQLGQAPVVLLYSRFAEFRLGRIVTLVRRVAQEMPEARWLIVGQGLQGEDEKLKRQIAQAGLDKYARFTGWLPPEDLPACFAAANAAIFPYSDTLINRTKCSVKLIDLLAAGVPVVADAVGQNCEYIQPEVSGVLVSAEDDAAFEAALLDLLRDPHKQHQLGQAAASSVRQHFNWAGLSQFVTGAYFDSP